MPSVLPSSFSVLLHLLSIHIPCSFYLVPVICLILGFVGNSRSWPLTSKYDHKTVIEDAGIVESKQGVVAADDGRCSEIGVSMLRKEGHAVDAAVATALCLGIVNPMASGIGGGAFMIVRSSSASKTEAFDMRETAPSAASQVTNPLRVQLKCFLPLGRDMTLYF